jgi:hypothetical protein
LDSIEAQKEDGQQAELATDPIDLAIAASSDDSSTDSEIDEDQNSDHERHSYSLCPAYI